MMEANYLVIGSGVAGLTFSVKIAEKFPDNRYKSKRRRIEY